MENEIEAVVNWWVNVLRGNPPKDNGDAEQSCFSTILTATYSKAPTEEQLTVFADALRQALPEHLEKYHWSEAVQKKEPGLASALRAISVDYHPEEILKDAAIKAGISTLRFPFKTVMWVDPGRVSVALGYRAKPEVIYQAEPSGVTTL